MLDTWPLLRDSRFPTLQRRPLEVLQVNLGYRCNQQCLHCHVNAGPKRHEQMQRPSVERLLELLARPGIHTLDLTGGAPEMNPLFRELVTRARSLGVQVIDRCNLTILNEPGYQDLADFLAENGVEVVASLPCYLEENVDGQRGKGVYRRSIDGLRQLNAAGYGQPDSGLVLNLVYNPTGPYLPPGQQQLEADYKQRLLADHGIRFNHLFTITNMPIARFGSMLVSKGDFEAYMQLLKDSMNPCTLDGLMCINQLSVDWRGLVYDCDFNQMLGLHLGHPDSGEPLHIDDLDEIDLEAIPIRVADHCYGCTAGQGSSCGGALD